MTALNQEKINKLIQVANDFGEIAQEVNESSKLRKKHAEEAINLVDPSFKTCEQLLSKFQSVLKVNRGYKEKLGALETFFTNLFKGIEKQKASGLNGDLEKEITDFENDFKKARGNLQDCIHSNETIIEMDMKLIKKKETQKRNIMQLQMITEVVLAEAQKAIDGSQSNLARGRQLSKNFQSVTRFIEDKDIDKLKDLVKEAGTGWALAQDVNKNSKSQLAFAENFNSFTQKLHEDSLEVVKSLKEKHDLFEKSLESQTALADFLAGGKQKLSNAALNSDIQSALRTIESIGFNYKEYISENENGETEANTLTNKENEYYTNLVNSVNAMTEVTKYPIKGSGKNIENGQFLENSLKEMISAIS